MDRNDGNTRVESPGMKVFMISLGCDKNLADSEEMLGILREAGFGCLRCQYLWIYQGCQGRKHYDDLRPASL